MYVDPFWFGFALGFLFASIVFFALVYHAGKRRKK